MTTKISAPLSARLIGTWELISREDRNAAGERRIDPGLGADPFGLLIYDRNGHFAAQFMKRDRTGAAPTPAATPALNNTRARDGYDAYFGTYVVDDERGAVTQTLIAALSPDNVGHVVTREVDVDGDSLIIQLATTSTDGEAVTRVLRWRRVG